MVPGLPRAQVNGTGMQHSERCSIASVLCREQAEQDAKMEEAIAKAAEELIDKFEEQWKPAMENLEEAEAVFDDLDGENCPNISHFSAITCLAAWGAFGCKSSRRCRYAIRLSLGAIELTQDMHGVLAPWYTYQ